MKKRTYLTTDEVQNILGISKPTLLKKLATGEIKAERADNTARAVWEIPPKSISDFLIDEHNETNRKQAILKSTLEELDLHGSPN